MSSQTPKICNREITRSTAALTGESERTVRDIADHTFEFVHARVKDGAFDSVYLRKFGKFSARPHIVKAIQDSKGDRATRKAIKEELRRQQSRTQQLDNEIIPDNSGLHAGTEHGMDPDGPRVCDDRAQGQGE